MNNLSTVKPLGGRVSQCSTNNGFKHVSPVVQRTFFNRIQLNLYVKFSQSQNYYYTRDVNDLLNGSRTRFTVTYRDFLAYDDDTEEYLKRYYKQREYKGKIQLLTEYYKFHSDIPRLFITPTCNILNIFHDKKRKIEFFRISKLIDEENRNNPNKPPKGIVGDVPPRNSEESIHKKLDAKELEQSLTNVLKDISSFINKGQYDQKIKEKAAAAAAASSNRLPTTKTTRNLMRISSSLRVSTAVTSSSHNKNGDTLTEINKKLAEVINQQSYTTNTVSEIQDATTAHDNLDDFLAFLGGKSFLNSTQTISAINYNNSTQHLSKQFIASQPTPQPILASSRVSAFTKKPLKTEKTLNVDVSVKDFTRQSIHPISTMTTLTKTTNFPAASTTNTQLDQRDNIESIYPTSFKISRGKKQSSIQVVEDMSPKETLLQKTKSLQIPVDIPNQFSIHQQPPPPLSLSQMNSSPITPAGKAAAAAAAASVTSRRQKQTSFAAAADQHHLTLNSPQHHQQQQPQSFQLTSQQFAAAAAAAATITQSHMKNSQSQSQSQAYNSSSISNFMQLRISPQSNTTAAVTAATAAAASIQGSLTQRAAYLQPNHYRQSSNPNTTTTTTTTTTAVPNTTTALNAPQRNSLIALQHANYQGISKDMFTSSQQTATQLKHSLQAYSPRSPATRQFFQKDPSAAAAAVRLKDQPIIQMNPMSNSTVFTKIPSSSSTTATQPTSQRGPSHSNVRASLQSLNSIATSHNEDYFQKYQIPSYSSSTSSSSLLSNNVLSHSSPRGIMKPSNADVLSLVKQPLQHKYTRSLHQQSTATPTTTTTTITQQSQNIATSSKPQVRILSQPSQPWQQVAVAASKQQAILNFAAISQVDRGKTLVSNGGGVKISNQIANGNSNIGSGLNNLLMNQVPTTFSSKANQAAFSMPQPKSLSPRKQTFFTKN